MNNIIISSHAWVTKYQVNTEESVLYQQYKTIYQKFFEKGVSGSGNNDENIAPLTRLRDKSMNFTIDTKKAPPQYGGRSEIWLLVRATSGTPLAFITAQRLIPYTRTAGKPDDIPEIVYIAHFGSQESGAGRELLDGLRAQEWQRIALILQIEADKPEGLVQYYTKAGFMRCTRLPRDGFWRFYLGYAASQRGFEVCIKGRGKQKTELIEAGICDSEEKGVYMLCVSRE